MSERGERGLWICRAEGTIDVDGRRGRLDYALSIGSWYSRSEELREMRRHAETKVLVEYFRAYDQVPYRVFWLRAGREWLEAAPSGGCCWVEEEWPGPRGYEVAFALRDTRDRTATWRASVGRDA